MIKSIIKEEGILVYSVVRWAFLAVVVGYLVGISSGIFLKALEWGINTTSTYNEYYFLLLPIALCISSFLVKNFAPDAKGHGTEKVIEAIHKHDGFIKISVIPIKLIATVITIAFGGSAGKEGPCAQIGSGVACSFARIFRFNKSDRKKLVICGISAGFSAVFGTPIAGAVFGVEVLVVGNIFYDTILPSFISSLISYHTCSLFNIHYFHMNFTNVFDHFSIILVWKLILAGIFFGLCALFLIFMLHFAYQVYNKIQINEYIKNFIGGLLLIFIALLFSSDYLGLGLNVLKSAINSNILPWYSFIIKTITTSITLTFGGSGGIITPIFFIGSTCGNVFAQLMSLDIGIFSALGLVALLSGTTNTPIASIIMAIELFGPHIASYASVVCIISFIITGHHSVYPSQILAFKELKSICSEINNFNKKNYYNNFLLYLKNFIFKKYQIITRK